MTSKKEKYTSRADLPPGGSYRREADGTFTRLDTPQKPYPGNAAMRKAREAEAAKAEAKTETAAGKPAKKEG